MSLQSFIAKLVNVVSPLVLEGTARLAELVGDTVAARALRDPLLHQQLQQLNLEYPFTSINLEKRKAIADQTMHCYEQAFNRSLHMS